MSSIEKDKPKKLKHSRRSLRLEKLEQVHRDQYLQQKALERGRHLIIDDKLFPTLTMEQIKTLKLFIEARHKIKLTDEHLKYRIHYFTIVANTRAFNIKDDYWKGIDEVFESWGSVIKDDFSLFRDLNESKELKFVKTLRYEWDALMKDLNNSFNRVSKSTLNIIEKPKEGQT